MNPKALHIDMCIAINEHNKKYYNEGNPTISDSEYDELFKSLVNLEKLYPELRTPDSPTQRIGAEPVSEFVKVKHSTPMMSIEKVYDEKEVVSFVARVEKEIENTESDLTYTAEHKIDGLSISLHYKNGLFVKALTRGNGSIGEDVTENVRVIPSVPLKLSDVRIGDIEIRGEIHMSFPVFSLLNFKKKLNGEPLLANPRNSASGALKRRDSKVSKESMLSMIAYDVINPLQYGFTSQTTILGALSDLGFDIPNHFTCNKNDLMLRIKELGEIRSSVYAIDGVVVKLNDIKSRDRFQSTSSYPKWLVAYKFAEETTETKLIDIQVQVGKTGTLTPVAILEPVELCGSVIGKASLHNFDMLKSLDVRIGDMVSIKKAGEIIPQVIEPLLEFRTEELSVFPTPTECPVCKSEVKQEGDNVALICQGSNCPAKVKGRIEYWASKNVMNIDGLGPAIIEKLVDIKYVLDIDDIYILQVDDIAPLDKMGKRSAEKLISAIKDSIKMPFEKVLAGLQIPNTGKTTSRILAEHFKNIDSLINASIEDLITIENIGHISAGAIYNWFRDSNNLKFISFLKSMNFNLVQEEKEQSLMSGTGKFSGETVCVTGALQANTRDGIHAMIISEGGSIASSISKKTTILIVGEKAGSKLKKAQDLGIRIMPEDEFMEITTT